MASFIVTPSDYWSQRSFRLDASAGDLLAPFCGSESETGVQKIMLFTFHKPITKSLE
jgi:hypothetical protein